MSVQVIWLTRVRIPAVQHWTFLIQAAEEPLPLSSRDGCMLRLIPANQRLSYHGLTMQLQAAIVAHQLAIDARCMLTTVWQRGRAPGRAALALMRGYAYLQDGQHGLAGRVCCELLLEPDAKKTYHVHLHIDPCADRPRHHTYVRTMCLCT